VLIGEPAGRPTGRWWLLGAAGLLLVGLAVWGVCAYRAGLSGEPPPPGAASGDQLAPGELPALGYLPDTANVIVGVHVRSILEHPDSRPALAALGLDPGPNGGFGLDRLTGVPLDNLDHVAAGVVLDGGGFGVTVVAQTQRPYDAERVRQALQAGRPQKHGDKTLYPVQFQPPRLQAVSGFLWCATDHTLVLGWQAKDFDAVPDPPRADLDRFRGPLPTLIHDRLEKGTVVWVAAHAERWNTLIVQKALETLPAELRKAGGGLGSGAVGLTLGPPARLRLTGICSTPAGAERLQHFLSDAAERQGNEVTAELPTDAETIRQLLAGKKK
jgi:hypothetical protein